VCSNELGCCSDTQLVVAAGASSSIVDDAETSVCPPLSLAMEAINMEASITASYSVQSRIECHQFYSRFKIFLMPMERIHRGNVPSEKLLISYMCILFCDLMGMIVLVEGNYTIEQNVQLLLSYKEK
jgi:hypothetical protein